MDARKTLEDRTCWSCPGAKRANNRKQNDTCEDRTGAHAVEGRLEGRRQHRVVLAGKKEKFTLCPSRLYWPVKGFRRER